MATTQDLKAVVKETLENRGVLGQIKARMRAEVFNALDDQADAPPPLSNENMLINELIREYLEFNKYKYTSSVLQAESGQPAQALDRQFLAQELNIFEDQETSTVPLLYGIIAQFLSKSRNNSATSRSPQRLGATTNAGARSDYSRQGPSETGLRDSSEGPAPFIVQGGRR